MILENPARLNLISLETTQGKEFKQSLFKYHKLFLQNGAWTSEFHAMPPRGTAQLIGKEGKPDYRWRAVFADCMNKRLLSFPN